MWCDIFQIRNYTGIRQTRDESAGCILCKGIFCDQLPLELDRVIDHCGKFGDDEVKVNDAIGMSFFGMFQCDLQNGLGDRQFVRDVPYLIVAILSDLIA